MTTENPSAPENPPAFPLSWTEVNNHGVEFPAINPGMTLRDYVAVKVFAALAADPEGREPVEPWENPDDAAREYWSHRAKVAHIAAEAFLTARQETRDA